MSLEQQMKCMILLLLGIVFLSACNNSPDAPTSTPSLQESLLSQIDAAQAQWQAQEITSYHVEVLAVRGTWHAQSPQITVRDGQVVAESASCTPAPAEMGQCEVEPFDAQDYTIPALFALARSKVRAGQAQHIRLTFDPSFGFPNLLSSGDPEIIDGGQVWRVLAFEALE
jgi:hypothetical protein